MGLRTVPPALLRRAAAGQLRAAPAMRRAVGLIASPPGRMHLGAPQSQLPILSATALQRTAMRGLSTSPADSESGASEAVSGEASSAEFSEAAASVSDADGVSAADGASAQADADEAWPSAEAVPDDSSSSTMSTEDVKFQMKKALSLNEYEIVLQLFESLPRDATVDLPMLHALLEAKVKWQDVGEARAALDAICAMHPYLAPNATTYVTMLKGLEEQQTEARALYDDLLSREISPTVEVYNELVSIFTASGNFVGATDLIEEMRTKNVMPTRYTFFRYINGCFKTSEYDLAFNMLKQMEGNWRTPDHLSYERMMQHFMRGGHLEGQMHCLKGIMSLDPGNTPQEIIPFMLRDAKARGKTDAVLMIYNMAFEAGVVLGPFEKVGVIFSMLEAGKYTEAFSVAATVEDHIDDDSAQEETNAVDGGASVSSPSRLPSSAAAWLAKCLAHDVAAIDDAYYELEQRQKDGKRVPLAAVNIVIDACGLIGDLDRAFATWAELETMNLTPDVNTFNALLHTCCKAKEVPSGRRLINKMNNDGIAPNADTYHHRIVLHLLNRDGKAAMAEFEAMKEAEMKATPRTYLSLIGHKCFAGDGEGAQALLAELEQLHPKMRITEGTRDKVQAALEGRRISMYQPRHPQAFGDEEGGRERGGHGRYNNREQYGGGERGGHGRYNNREQYGGGERGGNGRYNNREQYARRDN